jgi:single-strand DNA-binding protein
MNYNKVLIGGRLTKDCTLTTTASGTKVLEFSIASTDRYGDKEEVLYMDCAMFGDRCEKVAQYFVKGKQMLVDGKLRLETWTGSDGVKRYKHSVVVDTFSFAG